MKRLKRILILLTASGLLVFFVLPAAVFGEDNSEYKCEGAADNEIIASTYVGQYQLKELDENGNKTGDPIDVYCIDGDVEVNHCNRR